MTAIWCPCFGIVHALDVWSSSTWCCSCNSQRCGTVFFLGLVVVLVVVHVEGWVADRLALLLHLAMLVFDHVPLGALLVAALAMFDCCCCIACAKFYCCVAAFTICCYRVVALVSWFCSAAMLAAMVVSNCCCHSCC